MFLTENFAKNAAGNYPEFDTGETTAIEILKARLDAFVKGQLNNNGGSGWHNVGIAALAPELGDEGDWYVVNYFPDTEYNVGHLPTAKQYVPTASLSTTTTLNTLPLDKKIAVYCWTGQTSAQVTTSLAALGYDAYSVLYGVQSMCYSNAEINTHPYHTPGTDYPMVGTGVPQ